MERFAYHVLERVYNRNKKDAHLILTREMNQLGKMSVLLLVERQELMEFAEHSACQTKLTRIWKGGLINHTSEFKVCDFLTFMLGLSVVCICIFVSNQSEN